MRSDHSRTDHSRQTTDHSRKSDKFIDDDTITTNKSSGKKKSNDRTSFESITTVGSERGESVKNNRRKKRRNSAGSLGGNNSFVNRLDTSLLASVEFSINENEEYGVIDVEENLELNRKKEKDRKKMKKKKNKTDSIDPRLFPSYYEKSEKDFDDEDELSMSDFGRSSMDRTSFDGSLRSTRSSLQKVSAVQGRKVVQLSVVLSSAEQEGGKKRKSMDFSKLMRDSRKEGVVRGIRPAKDISTFSSPSRLLEIENGSAILVKGLVDTGSKAKTTMKVASVKQNKAPKRPHAAIRSLQQRTFGGDIRDFDVVKSELGKRARKNKLRRRLVGSMDEVNCQNFTRQIQGSIPFVSGYESYLLGQIVEVLSDSVVYDSEASEKVKRLVKRIGKAELNDILGFAFKNYNVSNAIIENIDEKWDFYWHWFHQVLKSRRYDSFGQLPLVGFTKFPSSENFSVPGDWFNKFSRQDPEKMTAQNLSIQCSGFQTTKRNQYGTYIGRSKTNAFRIANRLPVDESIVHAFVVSPMSTMVDNGAVHVLRQLAKHWQTMMAQPFGNLSHHRLEKLDPFETMRYHMPIVCLVLASLRGRNKWDTRVLGPFVRKCQTFTTSFVGTECLQLVEEMQSNIVPTLCAGVVAIEKPLVQWLEAIEESCRDIEVEAKEIYKQVTGIEIGLQFGYDLITQVSWKVPSDRELEKALLLELDGDYPGEIVGESNIRRALLLATPRDKKTLMELVKAKLEKTKPAKVLLERVMNLLKRDIRREILNGAIRELSIGEIVYESDLIAGDWYWLNEENEKKSVYVLEELEVDDDLIIYHFVHTGTGEENTLLFHELQAAICRRYIPVAESIVRAQRCYMNIDLDYCRKFKYNTFTEFPFLRTALNRLAVVSQIFCDELDNARLNLLKEVKAMNQVKVTAGNLEPGRTYYIHNDTYNVYAPFVCKKKYTPSDPEWQKLEKVEMLKSLPQSTIVVGSGMTGLMTTIHCAESVLASGGDLKLYGTSAENDKGDEIFEQAQIVRLDPRWVSLLRYHLGTTFEDTFIPTTNESHAHLGNNLIIEGFVEITVKDLECLLHGEVTKLWSKGIVEVSLGTKVFYDTELNSLVKLGEDLEVGDKVFRHVDPMGNPCKELHRWTIAETQNADKLGIGDLCVGREYEIYVKREKTVQPFKLSEVDLYTRTYKFKSVRKKTKDIVATPHDLPAVYPKGSKRLHKTVLIKCETKGGSGDFHTESMSEALAGKRFMIDIGHKHVVQCIGKPDDSKHHFEITSSEPYGFCCISRLDRTMGSEGVRDVVNPEAVQITRIIGDSIKLIRQKFIAKDMVKLINTDNWQRHFERIIEDSDFSSLNDKDPIVTKLVEAVEWHNLHADEFHRQTLQVKLSETVDNFYLAMELTREYEKWKHEIVDRLLFTVKEVAKHRRRFFEELKETLRHNIDILWFEACLEVLRRSGVYDTDSKNRIPPKHLISSHIGEGLKYLSVGDSFRVSGKEGTANRKFDVILKKRETKYSLTQTIYARSAEGIVQKFHENTEVFRESCLSRSIDGDTESKVAVATFPVSLHVNHHSIRANDQTKGYVFASLGDEQATSHFMHYSALSGRCINAVQFNRFLRSAMDGDAFTDRLELYSNETSWSNGEIIQRGIMTSFGEDGLLRAGFSHKQLMRHVWRQVIEGKQNIDNVLSKNWMTKFTASMIPRGMELNNKFMKSLTEDTNVALFDLFLEAAKHDDGITWSEEVENALKARKDNILKLREAHTSTNHQTFWEQFLNGLRTPLDEASHQRLQDVHGSVAKGAEQFVSNVVDFAKESHLYDQRISQELWNQPRPVDSVVGDFAADGHCLPNSLAQSTALCAASVTLVLYGSSQNVGLNKYVVIGLEVCSMILSIINIFFLAGIMINSGKYKARNGEARAIFSNEHFLDLKKELFRAMDTKERGEESEKNNPFLQDLEAKKKKFVDQVIYYDLEDPDEFIYDYKRLMEKTDQAAAFRHFQKLLVTYYIPDVYQSNSYVQDSLVEVYRVCDEIHTVLSQDEKKTKVKKRDHVTDLFHRVTKFGPRLQGSIDSGPRNTYFYLAARYLVSLLCPTSSKNEIPMTPIETETWGIIRAARKVIEEHKGSILKRQLPDLEHLYRATVETDKGAVAFASAFLVFVSSWIFVISRFVKVAINEKTFLADVGLWSQLAFFFPALLAFRYFVLIFGHSIWLWVKLSVKRGAANVDKGASWGITKIQFLIFMELLLTIIRICVVLASTASIFWCVAMAFTQLTGANESIIPIYIGLLGFGLGIVVATCLYWIIEFIFGYNLPTNLGEIVCEVFREELESMYEELSLPDNKFATTQGQERIAWEYVAREFFRKYRFDAIFGPDRAGPILQIVQCGLENAEEKGEGDNLP